MEGMEQQQLLQQQQQEPLLGDTSARHHPKKNSRSNGRSSNHPSRTSQDFSTSRRNVPRAPSPPRNPAPRKASSKTKNKECALCNVPLAVQWQKSLCIDCIQKTIQEETPDFASSLRAIIRAEVQDSVKAALKKKGSKHPEPVSASEVSPSDEEGQEEPLSPCSSSPKSSDSSSDSDVGGRPCFLTENTDKLVKAVRASMGLKDEKAAKSLEDIMFGGLEEKRKRTFPVNSRIKALIEKEWRKPEKSGNLPSASKRRYPFEDKDSETWDKVPKIDGAVARSSKKIIPSLRRFWRIKRSFR
ncbi:uncharacterized protein [Ranitomeya imitator]|uniref:uncharacterized protein n=1 Tax=Ranitomeya imitator TaxID=111125 RepID=UPI0037E6FB0A